MGTAQQSPCALYFDMDKARREEKRSKLAKAFSKLFKRRPASPAHSPTATPDTAKTSEWSEIPLTDGLPAAGDRRKSQIHEFGLNCKRLLNGIFASPSAKAAPKPIQHTIPALFGAPPTDDVLMAPIKSQWESSIAVAKPECKPGTPPGQAASGFQKLTTEHWSRDQQRMFEGTFVFPPGFEQKYRLAEVIGEGSFGFVWAAERTRDGKEVAIKWALREKIPPGQWTYDTELGLVPGEVAILRQLSHQCIVQFLDYIDGGGDYVCMVTELHGTPWTWPNLRLSAQKNPGLRTPTQLEALRSPVAQVPPRRSPCDLFECIEAHAHLPEPTVYKLFAQLLDTTLYMRCQGLVHRDLKDENIVVDEHYRLKLVDFGSAARIPMQDGKEASFKVFNGTLAFAAPEIVRGHYYMPSPAEVWTLGILLYTLAHKKAPFVTTEEILHKQPEHSGTELDDLIGRMLDKKAASRLCLEDIAHHPWMLKCHALYSSR